MKQELPLLSAIARKYLSAPPSSAASEREFKMTKNIQTNKRWRLLLKNLETLLFLKYNLRAVGYRTDLRIPPNEFCCPNDETYDLSADDKDDKDTDDFVLELNDCEDTDSESDETDEEFSGF